MGTDSEFLGLCGKSNFYRLHEIILNIWFLKILIYYDVTFETYL